MHVQGRPLRIALIADDLTGQALEHEAQLTHLTPLNAGLVLRLTRPDFLLVESAWQGHRGRWKYRIANYPDHPERHNHALARVVELARQRGIPSIFWNKEDSVHFDRFIASARLFDHIFTVDENCIARYRAVVPSHVTVETLLFAVQPALHHPQVNLPSIPRANFVGSYNRHIHPGRREQQLQLFEAASETLGLTIFDRNSTRRSEDYRYPAHLPLEVLPAVSYAQTAQVYRNYLLSLNVNTVQDSPTMFSRRLVEILACGGIAASTPAISVEILFREYCHIVRSTDEAHELCARLKHGANKQDRERAQAGSDYVLREHTWAHRLQQIVNQIGL
jgi:spore maturation protein CgeB